MVSWCEKGEYNAQKYPKNQSSAGSTGQTLTLNVSMTPCGWQICHQTHVLCGCTTFVPNQITSQISRVPTPTVAWTKVQLLQEEGGGGVLHQTTVRAHGPGRADAVPMNMNHVWHDTLRHGATAMTATIPRRPGTTSGPTFMPASPPAAATANAHSSVIGPVRQPTQDAEEETEVGGGGDARRGRPVAMRDTDDQIRYVQRRLTCST